MSSRKEALGWARASRTWRFGLRTVVTTLEPVPDEYVAEGARHNETFATLELDPSLPNEPYMYLWGMTPTLAFERFPDVDWVVYGDDDTVFLLDNVARLLRNYDPELPHVISDNLWVHDLKTTGPKVLKRHGDFAAPHCVPCGTYGDMARTPHVEHHPNWTAPEACPICTWELLRESDPERVILDYELRNRTGANLVGSDVTVHGGAGMLLSRAMLRRMTRSHMETCYRHPNVAKDMYGGDAMLSRCMFWTGIGPTETGTLVRHPTYQAFAPEEYQARGLLNDVYSFVRQNQRCCDEECRFRLDSTMSVHLRDGHFIDIDYSQATARILGNALDLYHRARVWEGNGNPRKVKTGGWDTEIKFQCQ